MVHDSIKGKMNQGKLPILVCTDFESFSTFMFLRQFFIPNTWENISR